MRGPARNANRELRARDADSRHCAHRFPASAIRQPEHDRRDDHVREIEQDRRAETVVLDESRHEIYRRVECVVPAEGGQRQA